MLDIRAALESYVDIDIALEGQNIDAITDTIDGYKNVFRGVIRTGRTYVKNEDWAGAIAAYTQGRDELRNLRKQMYEIHDDKLSLLSGHLVALSKDICVIILKIFVSFGAFAGGFETINPAEFKRMAKSDVTIGVVIASLFNVIRIVKSMAPTKRNKAKTVTSNPLRLSLIKFIDDCIHALDKRIAKVSKKEAMPK